MKKRVTVGTIFTALVLMALVFCSSASASSIWGSDATGYLTGSRGIGNGVDTYNPWSGFQISWDITKDNGTGLWTYQYTVTGNQPAVSHFILEVTETPAFTYTYVSGKIEGPDQWNGSGPGASNTGLPNEFYGIKFDYGNEGSVVYTITTDRAPVWGVFYAKGGQNGAWSTALNFGDYKTNTNLTTTDFIVRPDGGGQVPIPAAAWLLGSGLVGLMGIRMRRKQR